MKNLMVMGMMLAMVATGCKAKEPLEAQEAPQPQMKIGFMVHKKGNTLSFKSTQGAVWKELTYSCKQLPCEFLLNDKGTDPRVPAEAFSISFSFSGNDVKMVSVNMAPKKGTAWETLTYSCKTTDCEFKVTEEGVTGLPPRAGRE